VNQTPEWLMPAVVVIGLMAGIYVGYVLSTGG
jgi:hypothetical protein